MAKTKKAENKTLDTEMVDVESEKAKTKKAKPKEAQKAKESPKESPKTKESPKDKKTKEEKKASTKEESNEESSDDEEEIASEVSEEETEETSSKSNGTSKKRKPTVEPNSPNKQTKTSDINELYVGNLPYESTESEYRAIFEKFGSIENLDWKVHPGTEKFRGYCYVRFTTKEALDKAFKELNEKDIKGRQLKCDITHGKEDKVHSPTQTIFVKNLPSDTTIVEIKELFSKYGNVNDVRLLNDRLTGEFKRCLYIDFQDLDSAKKAFESSISVRGNEVVIDYATPKQQGTGGRGGFQGGRGGFRGGRGGRGGRC